MNKEYLFIYRRNTKKLNKKERKRYGRKIALEQLKKIVPDSNLLEEEDIKCDDVVYYNKIKKIYGSVNVLKRWKYRSLFPRNFKKSEYQLPSNVSKTGLDILRYNLIKFTEEKSERERFVDRLFPKIGKSVVNPEKLYDCFFKEQSFIPLLRYGDIFDFSWEDEKRTCVPGMISQELKEALGMSENSPPPWLFKMQKMGIPPSYSDMKFPGVNSEIPPGCKYGYETMGWGKPVKGSDSPSDDLVIYNPVNQYTDIRLKCDNGKEN